MLHNVGALLEVLVATSRLMLWDRSGLDQISELVFRANQLVELC